MKTRGRKPPTWPGWTQAPDQHQGTKVPATPKGTYPTLVIGKDPKAKIPDPFFDVPSVPGQGHKR